MPLDLERLLAAHEGENYALHAEHINPVFARVLKTIGFDRCYVRAEGPYLWDERGTQYLDMLSGYGVFNVGRNHPKVRDALERFLSMDYPSLVQMEAPLLSGLLAAELKKRVPAHLERVYFTSTGAEGVETAIKMAHRATGRPALVYLQKAFHGLSTGALALNGDNIFREGFGPLLPECRPIPKNDLAALEKELAAGDVAALVVEAIQGKGVNILDEGYLQDAYRLCQKYGTLLIADEVQCGMGRTGRFLAIDHAEGVEPDIVVLSKALSGGYVPVGAVMMRKAIYDKVFSSLERAVVHSSTFGQGSLAMVAGLATLSVMDDENLMERATVLGNRLGHQLREIGTRFEFVKDVRWRGLMLAVEFGEPKALGLKGAWHVAHRMDPSLFPQAVTIPLLDDHHILTQVAGHQIDVIKLIPPLVLSEADCDRFVHAFEEVMTRLHRFPGPVWEALRKIGMNSITNRRKDSGALRAAST